MCLLGANWNFLSTTFENGLPDASSFVLIVLAIAAAEVAIGLGLAILVFRRFGTINLTQLRQFSG